MKYIILCLILSVGLQAGGCVCKSQIENIYEEITEYVEDNVNESTDLFLKELNPQIQDNVQTLEDQNEVLTSNLNHEKAKLMETKKLIFLLKKSIQLQELKM